MNTQQEYTPKYWVVHDIYGDDVYIESASKGYAGAIIKFEKMNPSIEFYDNDNLRCSLISICMEELTYVVEKQT